MEILLIRNGPGCNTESKLGTSRAGRAPKRYERSVSSVDRIGLGQSDFCYADSGFFVIDLVWLWFIIGTAFWVGAHDQKIL